MIRVDVRLYSILRHRPDGRIQGQMSLQLEDGATVADVLNALGVADDIPLLISVNDEQVERSAAVEDGDKIELIPAVAGG